MSRLAVVLAFLVPALGTVVHAEPQAPSNAALRYWMAFASMENPPADEATAKLLDDVARGSAPWDEARLGPVVDANAEALLQMQRGTRLPSSDWGLDFDRGVDTPVAHVARARALSRLNLLQGRRLAARGRGAEAVDVWLAGLRFSQDLGGDGTLLGALVGAAGMTAHLDALSAQVGGNGQLPPAALDRIERAVRQVPAYGLDWSRVLKGEEQVSRWLDGLSRLPAAEARAALEQAGAAADVAGVANLGDALSRSGAEHAALVARVRAAYGKAYLPARPELQALNTEARAASPLTSRLSFDFERPNAVRAELEARRASLLALVALRRDPRATALTGVPADPFTGQALRVEAQGTALEVRSAGTTRQGQPIVARLTR